MNPFTRTYDTIRNSLRSGLGIYLIITALLGAIPLLGLSSCQPTASTSTSGAATVSTKTAGEKIQDDLSAFSVMMEKFNAGAVTDMESPEGQELLGDVAGTVLNVGLDVVGGNDSGAVVAGVEGAASALNHYSGLPTTTASTVAQAAAAGAGVATVVSNVAPAIATIFSAAKMKGASTFSVLQAAVAGLQSVRAKAANIIPTVTAPATKSVLWISRMLNAVKQVHDI